MSAIGPVFIAGFMAAVGMLFAPSASAEPHYRAEIRRTSYGVPHILASDFGGLGYGSGYAFAQDNLCLLADQFVTLSGERSKYFGAEGTTTVAFAPVPNLESDVFFKSQMDMAALRAAAQSLSPEYGALVRGYIAGYNRYLRDTPPDRRPDACRNAAWVRPATMDDFLRLNEEKMIQVGAGGWLRQITSAAPPTAPVRTADNEHSGLGLPAPEDNFGLGSNAWAFGRDVTASRKGVVLGNPHYPWETTNRFWQVHLTLPGKLDVMGVSLSGMPGVSIGFNKDIGWSHTVSTDLHFTVYELTLDPSDPTRYVVDGKTQRMSAKTVTVDVAGGPPVTRTVYFTEYGPLIAAPQFGLGWTGKIAYALRDSNHLNLRAGETWLRIGKARTVAEIRAAIDGTQGIPWANTIAADRAGHVLYADVTATPDLSKEKLAACAARSGVGQTGLLARLFILDGARVGCNWTLDAASHVPGLMPAEQMPHLLRTDYVANSNDSYWLANPAARQTDFSPLIGPVDNPQNLRTRSGLVEIAARLDGTDGLAGAKIDPEAVKAMLFRNTNHAAELFLDDALAICRSSSAATLADGTAVDLAAACAVLGRWDRHMNIDSRGAHLFLEFWKNAQMLNGIYAKPFNIADPIHTPAGLVREGDPAQAIRRALAEAVKLLESRGVALDARWGDVQFAIRGDEHIPIHGGEGTSGVLNAQASRWVGRVKGYVPAHGTSYVQVVSFDGKGPVVDAILSYSQSTDPASPHYADQTRLFSKQKWVRLPFHEADIAADKSLTTLKIEE